MSDAASIRAAIKAVMETVTNIGTVHDYERYADNLSDLKTLYQTNVGGTDVIRGWYIRRLRVRREWVDSGRTRVIYPWRLQGFCGLVDGSASEKTFDTLIDSLITAFSADETLGGAVDSINVGQEAGLQVEDSGPVLFGGVLCHSARCRLMTQHFV